MIKSKADYLYYLEADKISLRMEHRKVCIPYVDSICRFQRLMRKTEYYMNCRKDLLGRLMVPVLKLLYYRKSQKLGFSIGLNVFGPGLSIAHYGQLVVNENAKVGKNCRIHEGVTIGANTYSVHHYDSTWWPAKSLYLRELTEKYGRKKGLLLYRLTMPFKVKLWRNR